MRRIRVYVPGGRTGPARQKLHGTSQPNPTPCRGCASQTRSPSSRPSERRGLADLSRLARGPIDCRGARRPRRARGVGVPPAACAAGQRRRGRGTRSATGSARVACRARDHRRPPRAAGGWSEAARGRVVERMGSRGVPQPPSEAYTGVMSNLQTILVCRDFSDHHLTRGTTGKALVLKGSPIRVRPSALSEPG